MNSSLFLTNDIANNERKYGHALKTNQTIYPHSYLQLKFNINIRELTLEFKSNEIYEEENYTFLLKI